MNFGLLLLTMLLQFRFAGICLRTTFLDQPWAAVAHVRLQALILESVRQTQAP